MILGVLSQNFLHLYLILFIFLYLCKNKKNSDIHIFFFINYNLSSTRLEAVYVSFVILSLISLWFIFPITSHCNRYSILKLLYYFEISRRKKLRQQEKADLKMPYIPRLKSAITSTPSNITTPTKYTTWSKTIRTTAPMNISFQFNFTPEG